MSAINTCRATKVHGVKAAIGSLRQLKAAIGS